MKAEEAPTFSSALSEYITMALQIWPGLTLSLSHLDEASAPPGRSPIPRRNYREMSPEKFVEQIGNDFHDYIMEHDVKS